MNPVALALNEIGYDSMVLGNHEFNYGLGVLNKIIGQVETGNTKVLCANLYNEKGERAYRPYTVKEVDNNWKLTGVSYNKELRAKIVELINDETIKVTIKNDVAIESISYDSAIAELKAAGLYELVEELENIKNGSDIDIPESGEEEATVLMIVYHNTVSFFLHLFLIVF